MVDAAAAGVAPGTVHRFDAGAAPLPARSLRSSSHHFGVADAVELARSLDRLPARLTVYAIEGEDFGAGRELSPAVRRAVDQVVEELSRASAQRRGPSDPQSPRRQDPALTADCGGARPT